MLGGAVNRDYSTRKQRALINQKDYEPAIRYALGVPVPPFSWDVRRKMSLVTNEFVYMCLILKDLFQNPCREKVRKYLNAQDEEVTFRSDYPSCFFVQLGQNFLNCSSIFGLSPGKNL